MCNLHIGTGKKLQEIVVSSQQEDHDTKKWQINYSGTVILHIPVVLLYKQCKVKDIWQNMLSEFFFSQYILYPTYKLKFSLINKVIV